MKATFTLIFVCFFVVAFIDQTSAQESQASNKLLKFEAYGQKNYSDPASKLNFFKSNRLKPNAILKSAEVIKQRLDSIIEEELDSITKQIRLSAKSEFKYNAAGNVTQEIYYLRDKITGKWIGDWKFETLWNAQGRPYQTIDSEWDVVAKNWVNNYRNETSYNASGLISMVLSAEWDKASQKWLNSWKTESTYNSAGNKSQEISSMFNDETNQWESSMKYEYTYNSSGKLTQDAYYISNEGEYLQFSKSDYTYNTDGSLKQKVSYNSNLMGGWMLSSRNEYVYNSSGDLTLETSYGSDLQGSELTPRWKDEFVFDSNKNMVQEINHEWDDATKKWFIDSKTEYTFNNSYSYNDLLLPYGDLQNYFRHMITSAITLEPDKGSGELITTEKMRAYYSSVNISGINDIISHELTVFPNPASDFVMIATRDLNQLVLVELFDMKGNKVVSRYQSDNEKLYVNQLNSGIYICRIHLNDRIINTKMVKK